MTFNRLGIRNVCRRGSCVCPCSFYQTDRQPFRNWQGQTLICDEVARRRGRRRRPLSKRYQIIVRPSGTQIGEQNCQIRKHVVMQQWNEIDRRQETEGGEEREEGDAAGLTVTCQTAQQSLTGRERGSKRAPNFDATQQDHPSKIPCRCPLLRLGEHLVQCGLVAARSIILCEMGVPNAGFTSEGPTLGRTDASLFFFHPCRAS